MEKTIEEEIAAFKHKPCEIVRWLPKSPTEVAQSSRQFRIRNNADVVVLIADISIPEGEEKPGDEPVFGCWVGQTGLIDSRNFADRKEWGFAVVDFGKAFEVGFWTLSLTNSATFWAPTIWLNRIAGGRRLRIKKGAARTGECSF